MKKQMKNQGSDIEKIKNFLISLGFVSRSHQSAKHLIYSKDGEKVVIKNEHT